MVRLTHTFNDKIKDTIFWALFFHVYNPNLFNNFSELKEVDTLHMDLYERMHRNLKYKDDEDSVEHFV